MLETTSCPVCSTILQSPYLNSSDFLLTREGFSLVKCNTCGVVYTNPRISAQTIGDYYASDYTSYAAIRDNKLKRHIKNLAKLIYRDAHRKVACLLQNNNVRTVLEVGPGSGGLIKYLHEHGFEVTGIELDGACVERIKSMGRACYHGTIESVKDQLRTYDAVIMCQVLEHLYHPEASLKIIHSVLSDNGLLYLNVPNIASYEARLFGKYWRGLDLPRHITHFSPETLANLLNRSGYSVDKICNMAFPSSFIESLAFLMTKKGRFPNMLYYPLYYFWKLLSPLHVALMGSGIVEVVARKRSS